jgi:hypothetical protein
LIGGIERILQKHEPDEMLQEVRTILGRCKRATV